MSILQLSPPLVHSSSSSSYPPSTISSATSSHYTAPTSISSSRRIRFAPLPDTLDSPPRTESPQSSNTVHIQSTSLPSPSPSPSSSTLTSTSSSTITTTKQQSFIFRIFKRSPPQLPLPDTTSSPRFSAEDILSLGTSRFLRRPRTPQSQSHEFGSPLSRSPSASTTTSLPDHKLPSTPPPPQHTRSRSSVNSFGSAGGRHTITPNRFSSSHSSSSVPKKSGIRMLNGRVYGSKRESFNANPFANVRDDPEFVEWGYGGMGSVSSSSNSKYSVLATGTPALFSHVHQQKILVGATRPGLAAKTPIQRTDGVGGPVDDDDDGSGMGWVRKRKQERERLAREKEAHTTPSSSSDVDTSDHHNTRALALDPDSRRTSTDGSSALDSASTDISTLAASSAPTTPPSTIDTPLPADRDQHILRAVRLGPKHHLPSHHKRPNGQILPLHDLITDATVGSLSPCSTTESQMSSPCPNSDSSSDEGERFKENDEDDSEVEQTEDQRKTSLGAEVEKISRHKEVGHKDWAR